MKLNEHICVYMNELKEIIEILDQNVIEKLVDELCILRENHGRLFILGVGGSAANATHAVNDFRKLCNIESYSPTDNVSELTARINDDGWDTSFSAWLHGSNLQSKDTVLVLSVGGGSIEKGVSLNLVQALNFSKERGARILGIVGRDGGYTKKIGDCVVVIPSIGTKNVTPHVESLQAVVWHCLVSHPRLQCNNTKW